MRKFIDNNTTNKIMVCVWVGGGGGGGGAQETLIKRANFCFLQRNIF